MDFHSEAKMFTELEFEVLSTFGVGRAYGWLRGGLCCHLHSGLSSLVFCWRVAPSSSRWVGIRVFDSASFFTLPACQTICAVCRLNVGAFNTH